MRKYRRRASTALPRRPRSAPVSRAQLHPPSSNGTSVEQTAVNGWLLNQPPSEPLDAILVLGGGLLPGGGLPEWVVRRLEGGLALWHSQQQLRAEAAAGAGASAAEAAPSPGTPQAEASRARPCPIVLLGAGTPHKPPVLSGAGHVLHEATAYASYLMRRGVPADQLLKEVQSYDTVGNGYFSLTIHALPAGWRRLAVVTSDFHMARTAAIFDTTYSLGGASVHGNRRWFRLHYAPVSDAGVFGPEVLAARAGKEAAAAAAWRASTGAMASLAQLHAWLFDTHLCYSVTRQHEFGFADDLDPRLAATY